AARAEGGWLLNKDGYRFLQDYDLGKPEPKPVLRSMELGPRDRLSQAFVKEQEKGRTLEGPYGHYVHLDLRHLGAEVIDTKLPFVRELCLKYQNIDPVKETIPVRPVVHYLTGRVSPDIPDRVPRLRGAGRRGGRRLRRRAAGTGPARARAGRRRRAASRGEIPAQDGRARTDRHAAGRDARNHGGERGHLSDGRHAREGGGKASESPGAIR